jgi:plasmid stabilization system protein ParE
MIELRRHPLVESDIELAAQYYDGKSPGLGIDFTDEVERVLRIIANRPSRYSVRFNNWRRANLRRFPYAIFYQIFDDVPVIFAVLHGRSDFKLVLEVRES